MLTYILTFFVILGVMVAMAIGVIVGGKRIRGSCGGLNCANCDQQQNCRYKKKEA